MPATLHQLMGQLSSPMSFFSQSGGDGSGDGTGDGGGGGNFLPIPPICDPFYGDICGPPSPGPIVIGVPPQGGPSSSPNPPVATQASWLNSLLQYFTGTGCGIGDFFLRIAFFILGFIAIIGAIYLYKGSDPVLRIPTRIAHTVVRAGRSAAKEVGEIAVE